MKFRHSLRLYIFASMLMLSSLMAVGFSFLSVNYFIDGLDKGLNGMMFELSQSTVVKPDELKTVFGFNVASNWGNMPTAIKQRFAQPTDEGILYKETDRASMFSMPESLYFVVYYSNKQGEPRYISRIMLEENRPAQLIKEHPEHRLIWIASTGVAAIITFAFFLLMVMKKIAKPIESLRGWAKSLNQSNLQKTPPDFIYSELNTLATLFQQSLSSANESLEREQHFLSYASHELRTPISVIRSNVDLLNRLNEKTPLGEKQNQTLQRIERAGLTMSDLTDTLLWLSRGDEHPSDIEPVDLKNKIRQLSHDLNYLLNSKKVSVAIDTDSQQPILNTHATACHIVLTNLIRNAYQHTQQGHVDIIQQGSRITIINSSVSAEQPSESVATINKTNTGYGLGLELSEKIIKRHRWAYDINDMPGRYEVIVDFK